MLVYLISSGTDLLRQVYVLPTVIDVADQIFYLAQSIVTMGQPVPALTL